MSRDWNYIKKLFMQKCSVTDVSIVIETAFEAAIPTLYNLADYTCGDIQKMAGGHTWGYAKGAFKGIGVLKRRSSTKRFKRCGRTLFNEGASPKIFNAQFVDGFKWVYEISGLAFVEGALFKFFLFEVGKDFLINWMTLAYAAEKCDLPPAGVIYTGWDALFTGPGSGAITCFIGPGSCDCARSGGHEINVEPGCVASISWTGKWVPFRNDPANLGPVTMWLEDDKGTVFDEVTSKPQRGQMFVQAAGGIYNIPAGLPAGTTWRLKARVGSGLMGPQDATERTLTINTTGRPVNFMPMGGCARHLGRANDEMYGWMHDPEWKDTAGVAMLNPWFWPLQNQQQTGRKQKQPLP